MSSLYHENVQAIIGGPYSLYGLGLSKKNSIFMCVPFVSVSSFLSVFSRRAFLPVSRNVCFRRARLLDQTWRDRARDLPFLPLFPPPGRNYHYFYQKGNRTYRRRFHFRILVREQIVGIVGISGCLRFDHKFWVAFFLLLPFGTFRFPKDSGKFVPPALGDAFILIFFVRIRPGSDEMGNLVLQKVPFPQ